MTNSIPYSSFKLQEALARAANDLSLLKRMAAALAEAAPAMRENLLQALEAGDSKAIFHSSHKLRGAVANFGHSPCVELASSIEAAGEAADVIRARALMPAMERELDQLLEALQKL